jgi:copper chaperone CopZ
VSTSILHITGMRSVHCARAVHTALAGVSGAWSAEVTIGRAEVEHDDRATPAAMAAAVAAVGYAVERVEPRGRALPVL